MTSRLERAWRKTFHIHPYRWGNSARGLRRAKRAGYKRIDWDLCVTRDGVVVVNHWPKFRKDGFFDPLRHYPRDTTISDLTYAQVKRLRAKGGYRIRSVAVRLPQAKRAGLSVMLEAKGDRRFETVAVMRQIKNAVDKSGVDARLATLQNLGDPLARLKAAKAVGFTTILLARGRKPADFDTEWAPFVDFVKGAWR